MDAHGNTTMLDDAGTYDLIVIGAGVVGCAVARRFTLEGARVCVLERGSDILSGASKANSAILHTGFDAPPDSLELACMQAGYAEYRAIADDRGLPVLETGAVVAAWTDEELGKLDAIEAQARQNGVHDVYRISPAMLREREPHLSPSVRGGLWVPGEHVIDPWSAPLGYLSEAVMNGATVHVNTEVLAARRDGRLDAQRDAQERDEHQDSRRPARGDADIWTLTTSRGLVKGHWVVNCAGLFGDVVEEALLGHASFEIRPRKGQFVVFDKTAASLIRTILLPVPTERTKGVVIVRTAFGNVLVGPTAEEQEDRHRTTVEKEMLQTLIDTAVDRIPALAHVPVTAVYAGLRPATEEKAYRVHMKPDHGYIALGGIRSTGLTAALGLAAHAFALYRTAGRAHVPPPAPVWPVMPNLAEHLPRDWEHGGRDGDIVCHCERVTRREIVAALSGPVPARDFGGLRRRTRACMGRCQGFHCSAEVAALSAGHFDAPLAVGSTHE